MALLTDIARLPRGGWAVISSATLLLGLGMAAAQSLVPPPIDKSAEEAALKAASPLDNDPADIQVVLEVCTRCHSSAQFLSKPRTSDGWEQIYAQMARNGARPTNGQIDQIVRYFQRNLTLVNVNTAPLDELAATLQTSPDVTAAIVLRRSQKLFTGIDDLGAIRGVDGSVLVKLKDRLQF